MGKLIVCENCGKEYDEDLVKCPSCDSTNLKGAEKAYLNKLNEVKEELEDLDEIPVEELKKNLKGQGRLFRKILIGFGVGLGLAALLLVVYFAREKGYERDFQAEYQWKQETFPKLDELYEAGEYDALMDFYFESLQNNNAVFYEWEHYDFLDAYLEATGVEFYLEWEKEEALEESDFAALLCHEWNVKKFMLHPEKFTEKEYSALEPYIEMSENDFATRWNMSEEEYASVYERIEKNGDAYISYLDCEEYVKQWMEENQ